MDVANLKTSEGRAEIKEEMQKLMDDAVVMVKGQADRVEHDVVTPIYESYRDLARRHPTGAVFFLVFTLLSLFPIATFLTFSAVVFVSFTVGAVTIAVVTATTICAFAGAFLLFTLGFVLGISIFVTSTYVAARLTYRLIFHLTNEEGRGVTGWIAETLTFFGLAGDAQVPLRVVDLDSKPIKTEEGSTDEWSSVEPHHANGGVPLKDPNAVGAEGPHSGVPMM